MTLKVPNSAVCLQCDYSLRGLTELRCPECGRAFDPDDPSTFGPLPDANWLQHWAGPPARWQIWAIIGFTFILNLQLSAPTRVTSQFWGDSSWIDLIVAVTNPLLPMLLGLDYFVRALVLRDNRRRRHLDQAKAASIKPWRWIATPICLLLIYLAGNQSWSMNLRFRISQPAFEHAAQTYLQAPASPSGQRWVGLYHVRRIGRYGSRGVVFELKAGGKGVDAVGFVYDPSPPPSGRYGPSVARNWYVEWW